MTFLKLVFVTLVAATLTLASAQNSARRKCISQSKLICVLKPTSGNKVSGNVFFSPVFRKGKCKVLITADVRGLSNGLHGFHIHTYGDISTADASSLGDHFSNPRLAPVNHGFPDSRIRHWGDFGNLNAMRRRASFRLIDDVITLRGIVGRGIVVHADPDQGPEFQPTGNSGARQASCVIGFANPETM